MRNVQKKVVINLKRNHSYVSDLKRKYLISDNSVGFISLMKKRIAFFNNKSQVMIELY